jgi:hypothetical protein
VLTLSTVVQQVTCYRNFQNITGSYVLNAMSNFRTVLAQLDDTSGLLESIVVLYDSLTYFMIFTPVTFNFMFLKAN